MSAGAAGGPALSAAVSPLDPGLERWLFAHAADWISGRPGGETLDRLAREDASRLPAELLAYFEAPLPPDAPAPLAAEVLRRCGTAIASEAGQRAVLLEAGTALDAARVPWVVVKGGDLRYRVYPSPDRRLANDLDLLVPRHVAEAALEALRRAGASEDGDASLWRAGRVPDLSVRLHGVSLDLHSSILQPGRSRFDATSVIDRREVLRIPGGDLPVPASEDSLAIVLVHVGRHEGGRPFIGFRHALDVLLSARARPAPSWGRVADRTRSWGCHRLAAAGLWTFRDLLDGLVPDEAFSALYPGAIAAGLARAARRGRAASRPAQLVRKLAYAEGRAERFWLLSEWVRRRGRLSAE